MLGDLQVFGDLIYKLGNVNKSNNAAELFQKTTEKFSDWSRTEYSHEIGNLVEFRQEHDFKADQPELPSAKLRSEDRIYEIQYKEAYSNFLQTKRKYERDKAALFGNILGQCSTEVKEELKKHQEYPSLKQKSDVIGLLALLEKMSHLNSESVHPFWAGQKVVRKFISCHQQPGEPVLQYTQRFKSLAKVVVAQWGPFYPTKLAKSTSDDDIAACSEQTLVMFYLENADKKRFGSLMDNLMNQYISGNDSYPTTLVQAENLLTNYQDSLKKTLTNVVANIDSGHELSMVQSNKKKKERKARKSAREDRRPPHRSSSQRSQQGDSNSDKPWRTISGFQTSAEP